MQKPKISMIYLDLDGVVADFVKRYKQLFRIDPDRAEKQHQFDDLFNRFIDSGQFATLDKMPDADMGLNYLKKLHIPTTILSSTARESTYDEISTQKKIWLETHGITFPAIFVPGKALKYKYATPDSIIIDDTESVIDDWKKAGGIGILHKDWPSTLNILRNYI